jgi:rare lipoprotein A
LLLLAVVFLWTGCGEKKRAKVSPPPPPSIEPERPSKPPAATNANPIYIETGLASWYGPPYHNRRGSNGEIFDMNALTAAHRTLPLNSVARVTNLQTGHATTVRITDRGPFIEGRILDLSLAAAKQVDVWRAGTARIKLEVLDAPAPIERGGRWCVQIGAFHSASEARKLKERLQRRYRSAQVIQFTGPTGEWVRLRPEKDDKQRAQQVAQETHSDEGGVFLVRLD